MSINNYTSLILAVTEWLAREQDTTLILRIPDFITLAEAKFNRELFIRQMERRSTADIDMTSAEPEFISLPDDFQSMRRIRLSGVTGKPRLEFRSGEQLEEYRSGTSNAAGQPRYFSIFGDEIELVPTPDAVYELEMVYRSNIPPLNADNVENWLILLAPDLYLYGTLLETAPYIKEDSRIATWASGLSGAIDGLNRLSMTSAFNAGPLQMRVSGNTP